VRFSAVDLAAVSWGVGAAERGTGGGMLRGIGNVGRMGAGLPADWRTRRGVFVEGCARTGRISSPTFDTPERRS
jgi:hypothetical protein